MTEEHHVIYRGTPALASALADHFERQGLTVEWEPTIEQRDFQSVGEAALQGAAGGVAGAAVSLLVSGGGAAVRLAIRKFRERFPKADVEWREEDGYR